MSVFDLPILEEKPIYDNLFMHRSDHSGDYSFDSIFLWSPAFYTGLTRIDGCAVFSLTRAGAPAFSFPVGAEPRGALDAIFIMCREQEITPCFALLTDEDAAKLEALYPGRFAFTDERNYYEYLYLAEKLAEPHGNKMHAKRNHINRFIADNPDWSYETMSEADLPACRELCREWYAGNAGKPDAGSEAEMRALRLAFDHFSALKLEGGILRVGGKAVAFTMGTLAREDMWETHFEKAFSGGPGAYAMINREYARDILIRHPSVKYINREEDLGIENLRRAKESYFPEELVAKHCAVWNGAL